MNIGGAKFVGCLSALLMAACADTEQRAVLYEDVTELSGLDFTHQTVASDGLVLSTILGGGIALFDYDGDGDLDIYLVQGAANPEVPDELWRNDTNNDALRFSRVVNDPVFQSKSVGAGVAIDDVDQDGRLDVFISSIGQNRLLLNTSEGWRKSEAKSLIGDYAWSSSATWFDANLDGKSDLFVANVAEPDPTLVCMSRTRRSDYCSANEYKALHDQLFLNLGVDQDGEIQFEEVSHKWGLDAVIAPSFGVIAADFNNDMRPDVYVSVYGEDNALWINLKNGRFRDRALTAGVASSFNRAQRNSTGVDAMDMDSDGDVDIVVAHGRGEPHQYYQNDGTGLFAAKAITAQGVTEAQTGNGIVVFDADANGELDLYFANGALKQRQAQLDSSDVQPLREDNALFLGQQIDNQIDFSLVSQTTERLTPKPRTSRSVAAGDLDNDGDLDLLIGSNGASARLLRNATNPEFWIGINPVHSANRLPAIGARVTIAESEIHDFKGQQVYEVRRNHGFLSASDPRVLVYHEFREREPVTISIRWPTGTTELFSVLPERRYHTLVEGEGERL